MLAFRAATLLVLAVLALQGCGGDSAEDRAAARAAADAWSKQARADCEILGAELLSRSGAGDIEDIERYGSDVARLLRQSADELEGIPVREGAESRARPALDAIAGTQRQVQEVGSATRGSDLERVVAAGDALASRLRDTDPVMEPAGLRSCWGAEVGERVRRGLRAPIVLKGLDEIRREYARTLKAVGRAGGLDRVATPLRDHAEMMRRTPAQLRQMPTDGVIDPSKLERLSGSVARVADTAARASTTGGAGARSALLRLVRVGLKFESELGRLESSVL